MALDFNMPIIGADEDLIQQLVAEKVERKRQQCTPSSNPTDNRRKQARYDITLPVVCFPLLDSLEVDPSGRVDGIIVDVSGTGIGLNVATLRIEAGEQWVIAVESESNEWRFIDINVLKTQPCGSIGSNSTSVHGTLGGPLHKLFTDDLMLPVFDAQSFQYRLPIADSVLISLCAIGAAQRIVMDEVLVCPDCLSLPTIRRGCSICLSNETEKSRMIHHFACANVDFAERFDHAGEIVCAKCMGRKLIIGADYEYLDGPIQCRECGHNDLEEILIGHCMQCSCRFPFDNAESTEIAGYRVNRLDPLALLDSV